MIQEYDFLTRQETNEIRNQIHSLSSHWEKIRENSPFFTLGTASYLNPNPFSYFAKVGRTNPVFQKHFSSLLERLNKKISSIFNMEVKQADDLATPGFHIFLESKEFEKEEGSKHFDLQFRQHEWPYNNIDLQNPISITVPIALPKSGSHLNFWDLTYEQRLQFDREGFDQFMMLNERKEFPYTCGKCVIHRGLILHQIPKATRTEKGDERITLQAHGLICDGVMRIYW